jgi:hypothetical protein
MEKKRSRLRATMGNQADAQVNLRGLEQDLVKRTKLCSTLESMQKISGGHVCLPASIYRTRYEQMEPECERYIFAGIQTCRKQNQQAQLI